MPSWFSTQMVVERHRSIFRGRGRGACRSHRVPAGEVPQWLVGPGNPPGTGLAGQGGSQTRPSVARVLLPALYICSRQQKDRAWTVRRVNSFTRACRAKSNASIEGLLGLAVMASFSAFHNLQELLWARGPTASCTLSAARAGPLSPKPANQHVPSRRRSWFVPSSTTTDVNIRSTYKDSISVQARELDI